MARKDQLAYQQQLETAKGLLLAAQDQLKRQALTPSVSTTKVTAQKTEASNPNDVLRIINLGDRKLRKVVRAVPRMEREIQDAFENLLVGADISYSRETEHIEYSSKTYIPDFTISSVDLVVELKLCSKDTREKNLIGEINDDIMAYRTKHRNLLFFVYDTGFIRDIDRFIESFEANQDVVVRVVKH